MKFRKDKPPPQTGAEQEYRGTGFARLGLQGDESVLYRPRRRVDWIIALVTMVGVVGFLAGLGVCS